MAYSDLVAEIKALQSEVRRLADLEAIRSVLTHYGPAADRGDSHGAASLWATDGQYDLGPDWPVLSGRAAIAEVLEADTHQNLIHDGAAHFLSSPAITLDGDHAVAVCHSAVMHWNGTAFELSRVSANRFTLARQGEGWRIVNRENRLLTGSLAARALLAP